LLDRIGYAPDLSLKDLEASNPEKEDRDLLYRLGVAGFCFGNIMLLSFPEYLSGHRVVEAQYQFFFNLLNLLLALPVFFYSAMIYLRSAWSALRYRALNIDVPLALGIVVLFGRSAYEILSGTGVGFMDSLAGLIFFLLVGRWFQERTYRALSFDRDYRSYFPMAVNRVMAGVEEPVMLADLSAGDEVIIRSNAIIPADADLLSDAASIDYSFVSGEADPVGKRKGEQLFAGGRQVGSAIRVRLRTSVTQSYLTQLWEHSDQRKEAMGRVGTLMDGVARRFTIYIITVALVAGAVWSFIDPSRVFDVVTSVLIIACPCGLAITIPFALGSAMRILSRNGLHMRDTASVERMAEVDTAVFDKTGTLTESDGAEVIFIGDMPVGTESLLADLASQSAHPLSRATARWCKAQVSAYQPVEVYDFVESIGNGISGRVGAVRLRLGSGTWLLGENAPLADGTTRVYAEMDGLVRGYFAITKPLRRGVEDAVRQVSTTMPVHLLSGDRDTERSRFAHLFPIGQMHFGQSPFEKRDRISALQKEGHKVLMLGDGLNDSGALRQSDVGISVVDDLAQFTPACDAILEAERLQTLPRLLQFSRLSLKVVRVGFTTSFLYNTTGIILAVQGLVSPVVAAVLMPLSSITVVIIGTIGTQLVARRVFRV
jgi:Cu+-exporting ATPase